MGDSSSNNSDSNKTIITSLDRPESVRSYEGIDPNGTKRNSIAESQKDNAKKILANGIDDNASHENTSHLGSTLALHSLGTVRTSLFSPKLGSHRRKVLSKFAFANLLLGAFCCSVLSIYWGATYRTDHYLFKVNVVAVFEDDIITESTSIPHNGTLLPLTNIAPSCIEQNQLTWHTYYNSSSFMQKYNLNSSEQINEKLIKLIYDEKYWFAVHVKPNLTMTLYDSLTNTHAPSFNSSHLMDFIYESGRDPTAVKAFMLPPLTEFETLWQNYYNNEYLPSMLQNISTVVRSSLSASTPNYNNWAAMGDFAFNQIDHRPFDDRALMSPLQVGLIFTLILTVFQFSLFTPLHMEMAKILKPKHIIVYRLLMSWCTYFFMSLFFCTVSAIFQIDFTPAFGRGGFVVYWFSTMLIMAAVGGANENMVGTILVFCPQFLTSWLLTWIILNISPSYYPLVLTNRFYRYGYGIPLHNAVDIYKVIFLNLSRSHMGRNYGVLIAWCVLNTVLSPIFMILISKKSQANIEKNAHKFEETIEMEVS